MVPLAVFVLAAGALWALDRLFLAAEARGWVYWRKRKPLGCQVGAAVASELGALLSSAERARQEVVLHLEQTPETPQNGSGGGEGWPATGRPLVRQHGQSPV